jgi:hypothetical protein
VESGKWKVESGKWKVESGKWNVESGKWKVESQHRSSPAVRTLDPIATSKCSAHPLCFDERTDYRGGFKVSLAAVASVHRVPAAQHGLRVVATSIDHQAVPIRSAGRTIKHTRQIPYDRAMHTLSFYCVAARSK